MTKRCYLYWIKSPEMTDIRKEGYVGVSRRPESRFKAHKANTVHNYYYQDSSFREYLRREDAEYTVILIADEDYCYDLEYKLRPQKYIGWNVQVGGCKNAARGLRYKHGLSHRTEVKWFYNKRNMGVKVCKEWEGDEGLVRFVEWAEENMDVSKIKSGSGYFYIVVGDVLSPRNIQLVDDRSHRVRSNNKLYSRKLKKSKTICEWGEELGIKPNTISTRIARGWSADESLGLVPKKKVKHFDWDKEEAEVLLDTTLKNPHQIVKDLGIKQDLRRFLGDRGIPKYRFKYADIEMPYGYWALRVDRRVKTDDFGDFLEVYHRHFILNQSISLVANETGISKDVVESIIEEASCAKIVK